MGAALPEPNGTPAGEGSGRRILIDALAARFGGTAYAAIQLARHLASRPDVSAVVVVTRDGSIVERGLARAESVTCVRLRSAARNELIRRVVWEGLRLPSLTTREQCDLMISMSGMLPRAPRCALVCFLLNPVMFETKTTANAVRRWAVRRTAHKASFVAAPSRATAKLVSASIGRACAVAPLGVDHTVFVARAQPGETLLCVADFYAHKRHDLILDAWLLLPSPRPALHLIGNPAVDPQAHGALLTRIESLAEAGKIYLDYEISLGRLVAAYQQARVFIMASEHESFCMPLLESMACGVPAVVRDLSSLRDTAGDAASYVNGDDPAVWAAAVRQLFSDNTLHRRARNAALQRAHKFSWQRLATELAGRP
jgi:glycosyltransferase involved in cell wall biosynthesis